MRTRIYTSKQMGDACEMLIAAELTLAGVPAMKMPDNWPHYDVIAQMQTDSFPQRISVKSRTFKRGGDGYVEYNATQSTFDWLAVVILPGPGQEKRRIFIAPKAVTDLRFHRYGPATRARGIVSGQLDQFEMLIPEFENNFCLLTSGLVRSALPSPPPA